MEHETPSLRQLLGVLRRRRSAVASVAIILAAVAAAFSLRIDETYEAQATLLIASSPVLPAGSGAVDRPMSATTAASLIKTRAVAERVREHLNTPRSAEDLLAKIETSGENADGFVRIYATANRGVDAAALANHFGRAFVELRDERAQKLFQRAIARLERQLPFAAANTAEEAVISSQLSQLRTAAALPNIDAELVEPARAPETANGPHPIRDGLIGLLLGLGLGIAIAFLLEALDPRVKSTDELNRLLDAPQLAAVPASIFRRRLRPDTWRESRVATTSRRHAEPFERLRTSLLVFNRDRQLKSVIVTSPQDEHEGKTVVAANLAVSLAKIGLKVCVVEADLRRPRLTSHFGLDTEGPGLTDVIDGAPVERALQSFPVLDVPDLPAAINGNGNGKSTRKVRHDGLAGTSEIAVLAAGSTSASPAEVLASSAMQTLLDELESQYDVVILDCAPILGWSDALPLVGRASGTILAVRVFHTPRRAAARAMRVIEGANGTLLGVVGTGIPARELREEGFGPWPVEQPASRPSHVS